MKTIKTTSVIFFIYLFASCGPTIYKASNLNSSKQIVKTLAILPFDITIDTKRLPKGITLETIKESQQKTGYDMQSHAYSWFLKRQDDYTVTFQDIDKTNTLLKKANIAYDSLFLQDKGELCKLLQVDGVISGKATLSKPMSEGAAVTMGLLIGAWGSTNKTTTSLTIHDPYGGLLWKYDYQASGSIGSSSDNLTNALMRNASRKFPYKKS